MEEVDKRCPMIRMAACDELGLCPVRLRKLGSSTPRGDEADCLTNEPRVENPPPETTTLDDISCPVM